MDHSAALRRLAMLTIDRARGNLAPHKPLLLLAVLDLSGLHAVADPQGTAQDVVSGSDAE